MLAVVEPRPVEILLVDDRQENLTALRAILAEQPALTLVEATSSEEALRKLLQHDFALVLLDAFMPGMDGFEVARLMRERERTRDVPVLFLTAAGLEPELLRRAYAVGAADYLVKPIEPSIVRAKVSVFVELARKRVQLREAAALLQETERRRYRQLAESIPQIVWRASPDGQYEYWNQRWFDYVGASGAMDTERARGFLHPNDLEVCLSTWEHALRTGAPFQTELRLRRHDGEYRWFLRRALPEKDAEGTIIAWLGTDTDIDDRKRADDERIELLVRERAARFEAEAAQKRAAELYVEASEAVRLRDDFLTVAAHELRTPLTALRLQAQHLTRSGAGEARSASAVARAVERLCKLVDQLLDVSRLSGGHVPLQVERSDLSALVHETAARFAAEAERNGCTLEVRESAPLHAEFDPLRIEQVLVNLLSNAIKYGRGKPVELAVHREGRHARLQIRDHGIGVPREQREKIFERFTRLVSVREYGGLGLGLFISRQIVEAHGGSIEVHSEPGQGATFIVELPLEPAAQMPAQQMQ